MTNVCFVPYGQSWAHQGGHRTQQLRTAVALRRLGVQVVIGDGAAASAPFDIIHAFGSPPDLGPRRNNVKLVVSPVYFPACVVLGPVRVGVGRSASTLSRLRHGAGVLRHRRERAAQWHVLREELRAISGADLIVTNSYAEGSLLRSDMRRLTPDAPVPPMAVSYSGVDDVFYTGGARQAHHLTGEEPFVLCVGRPEVRKNQLAVCHAMRRVPRRLVLVGQVLPGNEAYLDACRQAFPSLIHIPNLAPQMLAHVYAAADLHILASHYETTGLATIEALAAGTPCVVGRGPCVDEYFGPGVTAVDPTSVPDIRRGIEHALAQGCTDERSVARRYSWDRAARELLPSYACLIV